MTRVKTLVRKTGKKIIPLFVPQNSWKLDYLTDRGRHICSSIYKEHMKPRFEKNLSGFQGVQCPKTWQTKLDYWLCWIFLGADADDYFMMDFPRKNWRIRNRHVTMQRMNFVNSVVNAREHWNVVDDKASFYRRWSAFVKRRWCIPQETSFEAFSELFGGVPRILVKPTDMFGGRGIYAIDLKQEDIREVYERLHASDEHIVVEEYIKQKGILNEIHPSSLNTIRVCTSRINGETKVCYSFYLAGSGSKIVSNCTSGGIDFPVNIKNGVICEGSCSRLNACVFHPETKKQVAGITVPDWEKIKAFACEAHQLAPEDLHLIGWDICWNDGEVSLIEGNITSGFDAIASLEDNHWKAMKELMDEVYKKRS